MLERYLVLKPALPVLGSEDLGSLRHVDPGGGHRQLGGGASKIESRIYVISIH